VRLSGDLQTVAPVASASAPAKNVWPVDSEGGRLFADNCALCHTDPGALKGIYGTDFDSVRKLISEGGNNIMSMPAYKDRISAADIELITTYLRQQKGWN
jgi:mono/diheme cytochrome c family protein